MRPHLLAEVQRKLAQLEHERLLHTLVFMVARYAYGPLVTACAVAAGNALYHEDTREFLLWLALAAVDTSGPTVLGMVGALLHRRPPPPPPPPAAPAE